MKIFVIIIIIVFLAIGSYFLFFKKTEKIEAPNKPMANLNNIKIAMIVASKDFRDEEYFVPQEIFNKAGVVVKVASDELGTAKGTEGGEVNIDIKLSDLDVSDFDVIVFIGGPGALSHLDNQNAYRVAKDAISQNKLLSAICISPAILAKAGVLQGKKATVWTSVLDKSAAKTLESNGAIYQKEPVVQDGNIITADGPEAAEDFANAIINYLSTKKY